MLDPTTGRARLSEDGGTLSIVIPAKPNPLFALILCFWLLVSAFGWISAFGMPFGAGNASSSDLVWLCAWTIGGLAVAYELMWDFFGEERVKLSPSGLIVERHMPIGTRRSECAMDAVTHVRVAPVSTRMFSHRLGRPWISKSMGTVQFTTYGVHTIGIGLDLDEAEARKIVDVILDRFPQLAGRA